MAADIRLPSDLNVLFNSKPLYTILNDMKTTINDLNKQVSDLQTRVKKLETP